jgi:hypothetical protein
MHPREESSDRSNNHKGALHNFKLTSLSILRDKALGLYFSSLGPHAARTASLPDLEDERDWFYYAY